LQNVLDEELERLKRLLKMGYELKVVWLPNNNSNLSGEVKDETIYIYEEEIEKALETLRHEFLDYAISQVIQPYRDVTNKLIMLINEQAYVKKEKLVGLLCQLVKVKGYENLEENEEKVEITIKISKRLYDQIKHEFENHSSLDALDEFIEAAIEFGINWVEE
jgi:hypothetical protein